MNDRHWLSVCSVIVAAEWVAAAGVAYRRTFSAVPPVLASAASASTILAAGMVYLLWSARLPLRLAYDAQRPRIAVLFSALGLLTLQFALLAWCKTMMDTTSGFWADPFLAAVDHRIFGVDPWTFLHPLAFGGLIGALYWSWIPVTSIFILASVLSPPSLAKEQAITSFFLVFAVGCFFQFTLPSAGPIFYDLAGFGDRFKPILSDLPNNALLARQLLWSAHSQPTAGLGISAMPSMHVAEAAWMIFATHALWRRFTVAAVGFFGVIAFGSVYMGLHYAIDGIVGSLASVICWIAAGQLLTSWRRRPAAVAETERRTSIAMLDTRA